MAAALFAALVAVPSACAAEVSVKPQLSYAWVDGDSDKFRAHHWMEDGFDGGIQKFALSDDKLVNDWVLSGDGRAVPGRSDYAFSLTARNEDFSSVRLDFQQFRKYYDSTGGVYPLFAALNGLDADRDLYLDIGKLSLTYSLTPDDRPDITFGYEFEYKNGTKSRLTWGSVQEGAVSRKIAPSWQEIDEDVHTFEIAIEDAWNGTGWKVEQTWEKVFSHNTRREINVADVATASLNKLRDQETSPRSTTINTTLELDRWLIRNKLHGSMGYRYQQIENKEVENIFEMSADGVIQSFANPEQIRDAVGTNLMSLHAAGANLLWEISPDWTAIVKGKVEDVDKRSSSHHPADSSPASPLFPDGRIDRDDVSETSNGIWRTGEAISLRFSGIPRVALYNDVEFEQIDDSLQEDRQSQSAGEVFSRQTDYFSYRGTETFGFRWFATDSVRLNAHYRFRRENTDFDDQYETVSTASGAKSAFADGQSEMLNELAARLSVRFAPGFEPALRYQLRKQDFSMRFEADPLNVASTALSNIYTLDLPFSPTAALSLMPSLQWQQAVISTPAEEAMPSNFPSFQSDVWTAMLTANYALDAGTSLVGTAQYQRADNFDNVAVTSAAVPFGSDYEEYDFTIGVRWTGWRKGVTLEPRYAFYRYNPNDQVEIGGYSAHVAWLGVTFDWV